MTTNILRVRNLSKTYKIYERPSDRLMEIITRRKRHTYFTSLKNVNLDLVRGQSLGIIGQNGAGKSTFLKLLANTLSPSTGSIEIQGSVAALLELGAGFNPEFSGRQNIYLNATLLGMSDVEIQDKEKEIIEFSELDAYIDRPIKTYSSGMYVRLGFAIATAARPAVLIIDEALSVGDANFQKKCVQRILKFQDQGASIIFCSHNLHQLQEVCDQAIWIHDGEMQIHDDSNSAISAYLNFSETKQTNQISRFDTTDPNNRKASENADTEDMQVRIEKISITNSDHQIVEALDLLSDLRISVDVRNCQPSPAKVHVGILLNKSDGTTLSTSSTKLSEHQAITIIDRARVVLDIKQLPLNFGTYSISVLIGDETGLVIYQQMLGGSISVNAGRAEYGPVVLDGQWSVEVSDNAD